MKKQNIANVILIVLLCAVMAFFSLSYVFVEQKSFSEDENRVLQTTPRFTFEKLINGTYTRQLHDYFSDQINLRSLMVELKAVFELAMGKNENNGILLGKDGYLIEAYHYTEDNYDYLKSNLSKIEKLMALIEENGGSTSSVIIPRKVDVLSGNFSPYYSDARNKAAWDIVGSKHISLTEALEKRQKQGDYIFYKTDHHWTSSGAYYGYRALADILGFLPYPESRFNVTALSNEFYGTTYSKSGFFFVDPDTISAPAIESGRYTTTIVDIDLSFDGLYDTSYLSKKDKYSTFLSGNNAHVKIVDNEENDKETLLIIKDSYSHALAPYLCEHYNLELIDPRYFTGSIEDYIIENDIKNVLFLFGLDTLASANISIR